MNLVLDFGNTRIKAGLFEKGRLVEQRSFTSSGDLLASGMHLRARRSIICSVTGDHTPVMGIWGEKIKMMLFRPDTSVPLINKYESALTLGSDRLAASVGACNLYPSSDVLTIDVGTCIKYNFVNRYGEYLGGAISPGIPMRLKAMNHFTKRLPLIEPEVGYERLVGRTTAESLLSGSVYAAACEADGMIDRYRSDYPDVTVLLTGGDAPYLSAQLKNSFFAQPNLLLLGLNAILEHNLEK